MEEIAKQLSPFIKKIYDNEKAFFEFFGLDGSTIERVSFGSVDVHVIWRPKGGGYLQTYYATLDRVQEFFDTLENAQ